MMNSNAKSAVLVLVCGLASGLVLNQVSLAPADSSTCQRELLNANKSISSWAESMEDMVNESKLGANVREIVHNEANMVLDLIEEFGEQVNKNSASNLARDLVNIRRRANRLALDIYLRTFDMRWPQNSLQLGVIVERVQQACLTPSAIQALESPPSPLEPLTLS